MNNKISDRFISVINDFNFLNDEKVLINKSELSKAVNVSAQSGESGYALIPRSYDKENREFEDGVVDEMNEWIKDREKNLRSELKDFYEDLNH